MKKIFVLLCSCLLMASCMTSKYASSLQRVQVGMTPEQVIAILGQPHSTSMQGGCTYYVYHSVVMDALAWHDEYHYVRFINGRVESYGKQGDFDSTKDDVVRIKIDSSSTSTTSSTQEENDAWNKLQKLKKLKDDGIITEEEFQTKKKEILDTL